MRTVKERKMGKDPLKDEDDRREKRQVRRRSIQGGAKKLSTWRRASWGRGLKNRVFRTKTRPHQCYERSLTTSSAKTKTEGKKEGGTGPSNPSERKNKKEDLENSGNVVKGW